jgi:hypothetical protein
LLKLGDMLPRIKIAEVKAEPLGSDVWRVTAAVVNEGVLPTVSEMGRLTRDPQRLQIELALPNGIELVTGHGTTDDPPPGRRRRPDRREMARAPCGRRKADADEFASGAPWPGSAEQQVRLETKPSK